MSRTQLGGSWQKGDQKTHETIREALVEVARKDADRVSRRKRPLVHRSTRYDPDDLETVLEIAQRTGRSFDQVVRVAVRVFVDAYARNPYSI